MVISISHQDLKKLKETQKKAAAPIQPRKNRTAILSQKTKDETRKNFAAWDQGGSRDAKVTLDDRGKLNDSFSRTGRYVPKPKK